MISRGIKVPIGGLDYERMNCCCYLKACGVVHRNVVNEYYCFPQFYYIGETMSYIVICVIGWW
jgi:hypothetical protein